uniref:Uncharacterized protein n=1 Tax=Ixodes ricinus TaxID=34613 RepID=A0A6B0UGA4_IXORI
MDFLKDPFTSHKIRKGCKHIFCCIFIAPQYYAAKTETRFTKLSYDENRAYKKKIKKSALTKRNDREFCVTYEGIPEQLPSCPPHLFAVKSLLAFCRDKRRKFSK